MEETKQPPLKAGSIQASPALTGQIQSAQSTLLSLESASPDRIAKFLTSIILPLRKQVHDSFDPIIAQAFKTHKEALAQRKRFLMPLEHLETRCRELLSQHAQKEQERLLLQQQETQRLIAQAGTDAEGVPVPIPTPEVAPPSLPPGVKSRESYRFEIIDEAAVKPAYLVPDLAKIRSEVNKRGVGAEQTVGGIKVHVTVQVTVRAH